MIVHYCFLTGVASGKSTEQIASFMDIPNDKTRISTARRGLIEQDLILLDQLLACRREMTYHYIHCVVEGLYKISVAGPFHSTETRDKWEMAFDNLIKNLPVQESVAAYLERHGVDTLNRMLQERNYCPPDALQCHCRVTKTPSLAHYESIFLQDAEKAAMYPCTTAMLAHASQLEIMKFLLPITEFSTMVHDVLGHTITRRAATVTTVREMLQTTSRTPLGLTTSTLQPSHFNHNVTD